MSDSLKRFWNDESGPELVEWAVVTIILLLAAVVLYIAVGKALGSVICSVKCWIVSVTNPRVLDDVTDRESVCTERDNYNCTGDPSSGN